MRRPTAVLALAAGWWMAEAAGWTVTRATGALVGLLA